MEVQFPQVRTAPDEVVRGLRDVDPRTVVLWWGPTLEVREDPVPGREWARRPVTVVRPAWLVGILDPYREMNVVAAARCRRYQETPLVIEPREQPDAFLQRAKMFRQRQRLARLSYRGFVPKFFWFAQDLDSELILAYQEMGWFARTLFEKMQKQAVAEMEKLDDAPELTERQRLIQQAVRAAMPDIWRYTFRGRRSVIVPANAA